MKIKMRDLWFSSSFQLPASSSLLTTFPYRSCLSIILSPHPSYHLHLESSNYELSLFAIIRSLTEILVAYLSLALTSLFRVLISSCLLMLSPAERGSVFLQNDLSYHLMSFLRLKACE